MVFPEWKEPRILVPLRQYNKCLLTIVNEWMSAVSLRSLVVATPHYCLHAGLNCSTN